MSWEVGRRDHANRRRFSGRKWRHSCTATNENAESSVCFFAHVHGTQAVVSPPNLVQHSTQLKLLQLTLCEWKKKDEKENKGRWIKTNKRRNQRKLENNGRRQRKTKIKKEWPSKLKDEEKTQFNKGKYEKYSIILETAIRNHFGFAGFHPASRVSSKH